MGCYKQSSSRMGTNRKIASGHSSWLEKLEYCLMLGFGDWRRQRDHIVVTGSTVASLPTRRYLMKFRSIQVAILWGYRSCGLMTIQTIHIPSCCISVKSCLRDTWSNFEAVGFSTVFNRDVRDISPIGHTHCRPLWWLQDICSSTIMACYWYEPWDVLLNAVSSISMKHFPWTTMLYQWDQ